MQLSIVIPVHNGGEDFRTCLKALLASTLPPGEIIVVDDSSSDATAQLACDYGVHVQTLSGGPCGPAVARNRGAAAAQGDVLVFIDADVAVHPDTLALIANIMQQHPEIAALFGSYDDSPAKPGLVTQYKNLQHHFVHQKGQREASTFWAGCGAVRKEIFLRMQGFSEGYPRPSIEDIELGLRLKNAGCRIWLCPEVQATHLKRWTFSGQLRSDILDRAIPWTRLILSTGYLPSDLNLNAGSRLSVVAAWLSLACLVVGFFDAPAWLGVLIGAAALFYLNYDFYNLIAARKGLLTATGAFFLHSFYFLYSSAIFGILLLSHLLRKN